MSKAVDGPARSLPATIQHALYVDIGANSNLRDNLSAYVKVDNLFDANLQPSPTIFDVVGRMYRVGARVNL